ncbi:hypothetical protein TWF718_005803 [Orbilia javanica]|uniref:Uncharacterized protein n=1 Tax=Orbilia javanica TaxID=47235 RepID=A0AAN8N451_9PEZI
MLFNQIFAFSALAFAASSLAATCAPNKTCTSLPKSVVSSCSKVISAKKAKFTTCTVYKTVNPQKTTKTVTVTRPKATIFANEWVTATERETGTVSVFSTVTEYTTTVFLEEASASATETDVLSFTEWSVDATETVYVSTINPPALKRRAVATPCTTVPKSCSCLLTKTTTKTVTAPRQTATTTKTLPLETVIIKKTATASVTVLTLVTTVVVDSTTLTESQYSTHTITATETTQTSETATQTYTSTVLATLITCADPARQVCGPFCRPVSYDYYNCGGCGRQCSPGQYCQDSTCKNAN